MSQLIGNTRDVLHSITWRRAQLLSDLVLGFPNPEIAGRRGLTVAGVRSHIEHLQRISGCPSRGALVRWWLEYRLVWLDVLAKDAGLDVETARRYESDGRP